MQIVVQKYGGSSVADVDRIGRVADRVAKTAASGKGVVVVVSAMGTTTDQLLELARKVSERPDRRELDMLISVGERITMALVAMALKDRGVQAVSLTGSQSGIITDEAHADARVIEVRPSRVRQALEEGKVVIIAGFQGVSRTREVTTLGRGGSDTTAVVLAAALNAVHCEICSDVDGVWSADPRVVPDAARLNEMGLGQALSMARGGAKVLFEDAVRYARDHGVTLHASSTFGPGAGTRLQTAPESIELATVTADTSLMRVKLAIGGAQAVVAAGGRIRSRQDDEALIDIKNIHGSLNGLQGVTVMGPVCRVTLVRSAVAEDAQALDHGRVLLSNAGVDVLHSGAVGDSCWFEVAASDVMLASQALHQSTEKSSK
ncbi:MAG: aspartate kinase [Rhodobacterales bacterium]|nr:aspartate kinase [Rhodobacterales bacterium]